MHKNEQEKDHRHNSLLALYKETWEEIRRLREFEWKIAATFVSLAGAFVVLISSDSFKPLLTNNIRWILTAAQLAAVPFGIYCLLRTHFFLTQQRNIRRQVENVLLFHEKEVFGETPLLPAAWKGRVTFAFQAFDLIVPLIAIVVFVQGMAIYITWRSPARPQERHRHLAAIIFAPQNDKEINRNFKSNRTCSSLLFNLSIFHETKLQSAK